MAAHRKRLLDEKHQSELKKLLEGWNEKKKQLEVTKVERIKQMQEQRRTVSKTPQRLAHEHPVRPGTSTSTKHSARGGSKKPS